MLYPYITWLTIFVFIPSIILWVFNFKYLKKYSKVILFVAIGAFVWGFCFDIVGSVFWHTWTYHNTFGPWLLGLPLEEYLILLTLPQELTIIVLLMRKKIYG
ncbi:MAG: hypothetical protein WC089_00170 [Candidatus Paceibacterota bacterium]